VAATPHRGQLQDLRACAADLGTLQATEFQAEGSLFIHTSRPSEAALTALKALNIPAPISKLPRPKAVKTLPTVLGRDELLSLIRSLPNIKNRAIMIVAYSAGLRVSEVVKLRRDDIDSSRGLIRVRQRMMIERRRYFYPFWRQTLQDKYANEVFLENN
jgi:integrase